MSTWPLMSPPRPKLSTAAAAAETEVPAGLDELRRQLNSNGEAIDLAQDRVADAIKELAEVRKEILQLHSESAARGREQLATAFVELIHPLEQQVAELKESLEKAENSVQQSANSPEIDSDRQHLLEIVAETEDRLLASLKGQFLKLIEEKHEQQLASLSRLQKNL